MMVVCEGVETVEERDTLTRLGCDWMQGNLFGEPRATVAPPKPTA
jgi:EAL domain-containing protein (putative c-di-GMP-specific phosphodiesterase class I)